MPAKRFSPEVIGQLDTAKSLGVRSGDRHKFTFIWACVVDGRLLARSWNDKPTGWFRAFLKQPVGAIRLKGKDIPARGVRVRSTRLISALSKAYAGKYEYKGAQHYVVGFRTPRRKAATMEFVPA